MENDNRVATSKQGKSAHLPLNVADTPLGELDFSEEQADWEERWAMPGDLSWRITAIPPELQEALDQGWFPPGADLLDIGCGSGECAAWLAEQGFAVLGVDFAPSAIAQARASHGESQQLQFAVLDIRHTAPERGFQVLFDRGCLHVIPTHDRPAYVRQISVAASPGAHFLLLHKTLAAFFEQTPSYQQTAEQIRREFQDTFDLVDIKEIMIPRTAGPQPQPPVPGLAIRLVRKSASEASLEAAAVDREASKVRPGRQLETNTAGLGAPPPATAQAGVPWHRPEDIESSIPARFEQVAARQPAAPAILDGDVTLTYARLNQEANRLAHALIAASATPVEAAGYLFGHGAAQIVAMLGILKTGGYCVPVDLALPEALNREILADAQVRLIVTGDEHLALAQALAPAGACIINLDHLRPDLPDTNPGRAIRPDQLANLHYTSGSTGRPKGVMQTHRNTLHFMATVGAAWPVCPGDRVVHLVGCSFSAVVLPIWGALLNGAAVAPCDVRQVGIGGLYDFLRAQRITTYFSVPTLYRRLVERLAHAEARLPDLRLVVLGGEPLLTADVASFRIAFTAGCRLLNIYAGAEMYNVSQFALHGQAPFAGPTAPIGYTVEDKEVLLLDETRSPVGPGEVGEIAVRSRYLASGYLNQPELTAAAFLPDPDGGDQRVYLTGDLGRLDADGCLIHMGRRNAMVKVRGQRVELGAIEYALRTCQGVTDAVVALREDARGEKTLVAYVVHAPAAELTAGALRAALRQRLPEVMVPHFVVLMDVFPMTPGGKVDRQALPPPGKARPELNTPFVAPRNALEQQIADIWAELLGLDEVGVEDSFFELGGDSIMAMRMMLACEKQLGHTVPPDFFRQPTVERLARQVNTAAPVDTNSPGASVELPAPVAADSTRPTRQSPRSAYDDDAFRQQYLFWREHMPLDSFLTSAKGLLRPETRVLDVGCGDGRVAMVLAPFAGQVTGIDLSPAMIALATHRQAASGVSNVTFLVGDGANLPCRAGAFDMIVSRYALEHVDVEAVLLRLRQLLRPGGWLIVIEPIAPRGWPRSLWIRWMALRQAPALARQSGIQAAWRIMRFRQSRAWVRHQVEDACWSLAQWQAAAQRLLPHAVLNRATTGDSMLLLWQQPAGGTGNPTSGTQEAVTDTNALASEPIREMLQPEPQAAMVVANPSDASVEIQPPASQATAATPRLPNNCRPWRARVGARLRRFMQVGPVRAGRSLLSYGVGIRLQRALVAQPTIQQLFARELDVLRQWQTELGAPHDEHIRRISLLANTWRGWREACIQQPDVFAQWVVVRGFEHVEAALAAGRPIVLVGTHTAVRSAAMQTAIRQQTGRVVWTLGYTPAGAGDAAAKIVHARDLLMQGGIVQVTGDGAQGTRGVELRFHGRPWLFRSGGAELALDTNALLLPVFNTLALSGHVTVEFLTSFTSDRTTRQGQVEDLTRQYAMLLENHWPNLLSNMKWDKLRQMRDYAAGS